MFKVLLAWLLGAIALGVLVPALHARRIELRAWMAWSVILASAALCIGPDLVSRFRRRR